MVLCVAIIYGLCMHVGLRTLLSDRLLHVEHLTEGSTGTSGKENQKKKKNYKMKCW